MSFFFFWMKYQTIVTWNKDWRINYGYWTSDFGKHFLYNSQRELTLSRPTTDRMRGQAECKGGHKQTIYTRRWTTERDGCFCIVHEHRQCWGPSGGPESPASVSALPMPPRMWELHAASLLLKPPFHARAAAPGRQRWSSSVEQGTPVCRRHRSVPIWMPRESLKRIACPGKLSMRLTKEESFKMSQKR